MAAHHERATPSLAKDARLAKSGISDATRHFHNGTDSYTMAMLQLELTITVEIVRSITAAATIWTNLLLVKSLLEALHRLIS